MHIKEIMIRNNSKLNSRKTPIFLKQILQ